MHGCRVPFLALAHPSNKIKVEDRYLPDVQPFVGLQDSDVTRK